MKILLIVLVIHYATGSQSSCVSQKDFLDFFSTERDGLNDSWSPLTNLLQYKKIKEELESFLHLKLKTQNCNIKDICSIIINEKEYKLDDSYRFCKKHFFFEYESNHVFKINCLRLLFLYSENMTFNSNEILSNSRFIFFTAR